MRATCPESGTEINFIGDPSNLSAVKCDACGEAFVPVTSEETDDRIDIDDEEVDDEDGDWDADDEVS